MAKSSQPSSLVDIAADMGMFTKFLRLLGKEGVTSEHLQHVIDNRGPRQNLIEHLTLGCPRVEGNSLEISAKNPTDYEIARFILGRDIIFPEEVAKAFGFFYTDEQLRHFEYILPPIKVIKWCSENDHMLVAGPPRELSLLGILAEKPDILKSLIDLNFIEGKEFSWKDKVGSNWLLLRKGEALTSTLRTWREQRKLLSKLERVPNIAEAVWGFTTYKEVRGICLIAHINLRTASVISKGKHVRIGYFNSRNGFHINDVEDNRRDFNLGVASVLK